MINDRPPRFYAEKSREENTFSPARRYILFVVIDENLPAVISRILSRKLFQNGTFRRNKATSDPRIVVTALRIAQPFINLETSSSCHNAIGKIMTSLLQLQRRLLGAGAPAKAGANFLPLNFGLRQKSLVATRYTSSSSSSNNKAADSKPNGTTVDRAVFERTVYVHPLSQIILEYLQGAHHDWVVSQKLDSSLKLHRDGSFELKFPMTNEYEGDVHRIWTSYDEVEKKHWLTIFRGSNIQERFLLQDNLLSAWNNNRKSLPERIHASVDEMIRIVNDHKA